MIRAESTITVSWRADWCQVKVLYCRFILNLVQHRLYVLCRVIIIFCQHNLVVLLLYDDNIQVPGVSPASIWCPFNQWLLCWLMADDARCYGRNFTTVCSSLPSLYISCRRLWSSPKKLEHAWLLCIVLFSVWLWYWSLHWIVFPE